MIGLRVIPWLSCFSLRIYLPRRKRIQLGYEPTYYGASYTIAQELKLRSYNPASCYVWTHGCRLIGPEDARYYIRFPKLKGNILVARQDEKRFLEDQGFRNIHAVGMPILYARRFPLQKRPDSILVMPPHATLHSGPQQEISSYLDFVCGLREKFSHVVCCLSRQCQRNLATSRLFVERGIPVITGAAIDDGNSLARTRSLLENFEYVTTNSYGSHLAYAMAFGAKVSVAGPIYHPKSEDLQKEPFYQENPDLIAPSALERQTETLETMFRALRVDPWKAECRSAWGEALIGADNVRPPREIGKLLGLKGA